MRQAYDYWQDQPGNCLSEAPARGGSRGGDEHPRPEPPLPTPGSSCLRRGIVVRHILAKRGPEPHAQLSAMQPKSSQLPRRPSECSPGSTPATRKRRSSLGAPERAAQRAGHHRERPLLASFPQAEPSCQLAQSPRQRIPWNTRADVCAVLAIARDKRTHREFIHALLNTGWPPTRGRGQPATPLTIKRGMRW